MNNFNIMFHKPADSERSIRRYVFVGHVDKHLLVACVGKTAWQQLFIKLKYLHIALQTLKHDFTQTAGGSLVQC